jgi:hypothetical protein
MDGLCRDERAEFALMVLVVGQALIDLGACQPGETGHHIVHSDSRAFHNGMARPHLGSLDYLAVACCNHDRYVSASQTHFKICSGERRGRGVAARGRLIRFALWISSRLTAFDARGDLRGAIGPPLAGAPTAWAPAPGK